MASKSSPGNSYRTGFLKSFDVFLSVCFLLSAAGCGPIEKGKVRVTAFVHNNSNYALLISGPSISGVDTIKPGEEFTFIQEKYYKSKSKPLCCPCAGEVDKFTLTVADTLKRISKDLADATLWKKETMVRLDYWICRMDIDSSDVVNK